jgi:aerobic carbon-monoxide dehydrogenase medium subunit
VIPAAFDYVRAGSVDEAISLLGSKEDAKLLAGGHSLLPAMRLRIARPGTLVDIGRLSDLAYVREADGHVAIGALTRHHHVANAELLQTACPIVAYAAGQVGDPAVRHVGTIGGSVAHGDPAADMPSVLVALDATFVAQGANGTREIAATDFFSSFLETALESGEVLTEIRVPKTTAGWAYLKFNRRAQDWAMVGVAAVRSNGGVHVGLTNMGLTPLRASGVEEAVTGGADPASAAERADEGTAPPSDAFGSAEYRRHLVKVLTKRALEEAMG